MSPPTGAGTRILLVDDEQAIRKFLRIALEAQGFETVEAARGVEAVGKAALEQPALVVLDLGLPDLDGKEVVGRIREWSDVPILVLSVRESEKEKVAALDAGANDYVVKPFGVAELLARIRALLRPRRGAADPQPAVVSVGALSVDLARHEVRVDGGPVKLTPKEFELLRTLAANAGRLMTHQQLLKQVWGPAHEHDRQYLRVFIGQLRNKLGDDPAQPRFIVNEPGVGYRMIEPG